MSFSARFTTSSTYGLSSSVRYAPTPRLSLFGFWHSRNATETPRMGSGGACSTSDRKDAPARGAGALFREIGRRDRRAPRETAGGEKTGEAREAAMLSIGSEASPRGAARAGFCRSARLRGGALEVAVGKDDAPEREKNPATRPKRRLRASRFRAKRRKATKRVNFFFIVTGTIVLVGFREII